MSAVAVRAMFRSHPEKPAHSETMSRISSLFRVCRYPDAIVYQRPEAERDHD